MFECHYPVNPLQNNMLTKKTHGTIQNEYLSGVDYLLDTIKALKFPEKYTETTLRFADGFYSTLKRHEEEGALVIMVSHGRGIEEFNRYYNQGVTELCGYCGISAVKKELSTDQWKLFMCNNEFIKK